MGKGGQAEVFQARDKLTNNTVAFKRVITKDIDSIARLKREIEVQESLKHPNIMPVLDHSTAYHWYTMPLAVRVLGQLLTPIDDQTLLEIVNDCATGLLVAHQKGYVHRDLSPNNIFQLKDDNEELHWVISDWGLVRRHGQTSVVRTPAGHQFGTAGFSAPESWIDAHTADNRADIYSLGRIVSWCLTGKWPSPNIPLYPEGKWYEFVLSTTMPDLSQRVQNMNDVFKLLGGLKNP